MLRKVLSHFDQNTFMSFEKSEGESKALINSQALAQFENTAYFDEVVTLILETLSISSAT